MKKLLMLFALLFSIVTLVGCFAEISKFEISKYPKTTYALNEKFDWEGVEVKIDDVAYNYEAAKAKKVEFPAIADIKTDKAGTYSITVRYETLSVTFQYTVLDSYFANGNGTKENPYQISTKEQFMELGKTYAETKYFVLINDIDFGGGEIAIDKVENVVLDGQGYQIKNFNSYVFNNVYSSEIKNLNFTFKQYEEYFKDLYGLISNRTKAAKFENINLFGAVRLNGLSNGSLFGYNKSGICLLKNINNYADIININGRDFGLFAAGFLNDSENTAVTYLLNCKNYGQIFGDAVGFIVGNGAYYKSNGSALVIDAETKNFGKFISTKYESTIVVANLNGTYADWNISGKDTKFYKLDTKLSGIVDYDKIATSAGFTQLENNDALKACIEGVGSVHFLNFETSSLQMSKEQNSKIKFTCTDQQNVAKYVVTISVSQYYRLGDLSIKPGTTGHISMGSYMKFEAATLEELNALDLYAYKLKNWFDGVVPSLEKDDNEKKIKHEVISTILRSPQLSKLGLMKTVSDGGTTFYAHQVVIGEEFNLIDTTSEVVYAVTALNAEGLPVASASITVD